MLDGIISEMQERSRKKLAFFPTSFLHFAYNPISGDAVQLLDKMEDCLNYFLFFLLVHNVKYNPKDQNHIRMKTSHMLLYLLHNIRFLPIGEVGAGPRTYNVTS